MLGHPPDGFRRRHFLEVRNWQTYRTLTAALRIIK